MKVDVEKDEQEDMVHKKFTYWTLFNWKSHDVRIRKTKPKKSELSPYEVPVKQEMMIKVPEREVYKASGEIELSREQVKRMTVERL